MRLVLVVALGGLALTLVGCGGGSNAADHRRATVNEYFDRVDRAEEALLASTGQIDETFRGYSLSRITPTEQRQLALAEKTIKDALRGVRAIDPPPVAQRIHTDLLELNGLQYNLAHELAWTADYLPRFSRALAPLPAAGGRLGHDISAAGTTPLKPATAPSSSPGAAAWTQAGCGDCHTLAAAGASGTAGPNLDQLHPTAAQVEAQVRSGGPGMPSFKLRLSASQIAALASFVASSESPPSTTASVLNAYGAAFSRYGAALERIRVAVGRLDPPPVFRPTYLAEKRLLAKGGALCTAISTELAHRQVDRADANIKELFLAIATGVTTAKDRSAANAAVKAYNAQIARIATLTSAIARERNNLLQKTA